MVTRDRWKKTKEKLEEVSIHQDIFIPKCKPLPETCERTRLGKLENADHQYRCEDNIHLRWFESSNLCLSHRDREDPRNRPLKHLLCDEFKVSENWCKVES